MLNALFSLPKFRLLYEIHSEKSESALPESLRFDRRNHRFRIKHGQRRIETLTKLNSISERRVAL